MEIQQKLRPYWHVDAKWVSGILLFFALSAALALFNLAALTERDFAVRATATVVAGFFSKDGLDDPKDVEVFRQRAATTPGETVAPIEQFPWITLTKKEIAELSPRELRVKIFSQITAPIYDKGLKGAAADFTKNPIEQEQFVKQAGILGLVTKSTHQTIQTAFAITAILTVVLLGATIYFSAGWGRAVSPGLLLFGASLLGTFLGLLATYSPKDGDGPFSAMPTELREGIAASLTQSYLPAAILGLALLLGALIGKTVQRVVQRKVMKSKKS